MQPWTLYALCYTILALGHIGFQLLFGHIEYLRQKRHYRLDGPAGRHLDLTSGSIAVVVPIYNEKPAVVEEVLHYLDQQDAPNLTIIVIDDGSANQRDHEAIYARYAGNPRFLIREETVNRGKRHAMKIGFDLANTDFVVTVDSDTLVKDPTAVRRLMVPFYDDARIAAITGDVRVENAKVNLLTWLIKLRYWMAFNQERAAQSLFGVVACCSGPFSVYRRDVLREIEDDFVTQMFLGRPCTFGDDRHLTNLVLEKGHRVVYNHLAWADTHVPEDGTTYIKQQTRWNKSFYREFLWTAKFVHRRNAYLGIDMLLQAVLPFMLMIALVGTILQASTGNTTIIWHYLLVLLAIGLLRACYGGLRTRNAGFLIFMVYGLIHVIVLMPVRLWAMFTIRRTHWGTRGAQTESAEQPASL